jgi:hypothetical protein
MAPIPVLGGQAEGVTQVVRARAFSISAASRTERAIGPATATEAKAPSGHCGTRPKEGFTPTTPQ